MLTMMMAQVAGEESSCLTPMLAAGWGALAVTRDATQKHQPCLAGFMFAH